MFLRYFFRTLYCLLTILEKRISFWMSVDCKLTVANFCGVFYLIFLIIAIAVFNLFFTCPSLYGEDGCGWTLFYAFVIILQIALNLTLFHYFNRRNQVSYWRVKSTSFLQESDFTSSLIPESCQLKRQFTALNIQNDETFPLNGKDFELSCLNDCGKKIVNLSVDCNENKKENEIGAPEYKNNFKTAGRISAKRKSVESILTANKTVREAPNNANCYQHETNRLFPFADGTYHSESQLIASAEGLETTNENAPLLNNYNLTTKTMENGIPRSSTTKWCHECSQMTPRRCHHCPLCNICVLRKDHHCFITGGCVGLANQRYFIVFLFWAVIGSFYGIIFNFSYLNRFVMPWYPWGWLYYIGPVAIVRWLLLGTETFFNMFLAVMFSVSVAPCMGAFSFLCAQMFYTLNGYTMHDYHVGRLKEQLESDGENYTERLALVFGRRWWLNFLIPQFWLPNEMTPAIARNIFVSISKDL